MRRLYFLWLGILWLILSGFALFSELSRRPQLVIKWETETEVNTAGFNLYRADNRDGPFERLNDVLVPAADDPLAGGEYQFLDEDVEPGKVYFYRLEEVEIDGRTNHTDLDQIQTPGARPWTVALPAVGVLVGLVLSAVGMIEPLFIGRGRDDKKRSLGEEIESGQAH